MTHALCATAVSAAYEAGRQVTRAIHLDGSANDRRDACLDKAEDELRLALRLITEAREPKAATVHPIMAAVLRDFGLPVSAPSNVIPISQDAA